MLMGCLDIRSWSEVVAFEDGAIQAQAKLLDGMGKSCAICALASLMTTITSRRPENLADLLHVPAHGIDKQCDEDWRLSSVSY